MFTGIIQEVGRVERLLRKSDNVEFTIAVGKLAEQMLIGDSIAISGVCLTATAINVATKQVSATAVKETLSRSTLGELRQNDRVNLELALRPSDHLGGHFVQGHVDAVGRCVGIQNRGGSREVTFEFPASFGVYVVEKGSIAIDGISLTAYEVKSSSFAVSIIPHTWETTTMKELQSGQGVNLEFDLIAKYVAKLTGKQAAGGITPEKLREYGY